MGAARCGTGACVTEAEAESHLADQHPHFGGSSHLCVDKEDSDAVQSRQEREREANQVADVRNVERDLVRTGRPLVSPTVAIDTWWVVSRAAVCEDAPVSRLTVATKRERRGIAECAMQRRVQYSGVCDASAVHLRRASRGTS